MDAKNLSGKRYGYGMPIVLGVLSLVLLVLSFISVQIFGKSCSLTFSTDEPQRAVIRMDPPSVIEVVGTHSNGTTLTLDLHAVSPGNTFVIVSEHGTAHAVRLYVHRTGIITIENYFGRCRGDILFSASFALVLLAAILMLTERYRRSTRISLCRYENAWILGVLIFLVSLLAKHMISFFLLSLDGSAPSVLELFESTLTSAQLFTLLLLPVALIISIVISISNVILMKNEGIGFRNMLGLFLGITLCIGSVAPFIVYPLMEKIGLDVHRYSSFWVLASNTLEDVIGVVMAYLECVLLGTAISAIRAAKHVPTFDKTHILILGCKITKDGGLTKLLQSRTDRAVEFARMQKEKTGRDIFFVPSGGQGSDEVIADGTAIGRYLASIGIPHEQILVEDRSTNTIENLRFSNDLIRAQAPDAKVAFSTTNYHVFRAGCYADELDIPMEGIGARTKSYFWINAFIREFIATLHYERRSHIRMLLAILCFVLPLETVIYLSFMN